MTDKEIIDTVKDRLVKVYNPREIYLFGSYVWGKPDDQSDLDLLVVVNESEEKPYKRAKRGVVALFGLGIANDIMVFTRKEFEQLAGDVSTLCHKTKRGRR